MAVNLQVSAEQAALLAPLLKQISSATLAPGNDDNPLQPTASVDTSPMPLHCQKASEKSPRDSAGSFCVTELLTKKKKNECCSPAQTHLLVSDKFSPI